MSPHRSLSFKSQRQPTAIQDIFLGIAFQLAPSEPNKSTRDLEYTAVLHDGTGVVGTETFHLDYQVSEEEDEQVKEAKRVSQEVLMLMRKIQTQNGQNVRRFSWCDGQLFEEGES